jgi:extracellular elastinolytic metalloproteinase
MPAAPSAEENPLILTSAAVPPRVLVRAFAAAATLLALGAPAAYAVDPEAAIVDRTTGLTGPPPAAMDRAQDRLRDQLGARALVQPDPTAGTPRIVARLDGFLTPPSNRAPEAIALDYVRDHAAAFGLDGADLSTLDLTARRRGADGTVHLAWQQDVGGVPNVDGGLQAAVDADGRLINVRGGPLPDPQASEPTPRISAEAAYEAALPGTASAPPAGTARGAERRTPFLHGGEASLVLYRDGDADRLGWRVLAPAGSDAFYDAIVDARTGRLQRRVNRVRSDSRIRHYRVNPRATADGVAEPALLTTIPSGWLGTEPRLKGPFVHAVSDLDDTIWLKSAEPFQFNQAPAPADDVVPTSTAGSDRTWNYGPQLSGTCPSCTSWSPGTVTANRDFTTSQLFWYANTFHDHLAQPPIGFTGQGAFEGDDPVIAQSLDGATTGPDVNHLSNANMLVLPDGRPGLMQMYLFGSPPSVYGRYDGGMDAGVVYHEYTHGLSERLVTDSGGYGALLGQQPGAIAEGTSDFYAMDFLVETEAALVPDNPGSPGEVRIGRWLRTTPSALSPVGMRTQGLDCAVGVVSSACPGTDSAGSGGYDYADFGKVLGAPQAHDDGEIWGQTLWSLRSALIAKYPTSEPNALYRVRTYVTGGLRLSPENPTFLDMRNAIVQAAVASQYGTQDWSTIWDVFAKRGMGWTATTDGPTDVSPTAKFDMPPAGSQVPGAIQGTIEDELGAPVGGATVGLGAPGISTTSDGVGNFALSNVVAGAYADLYFHKPGYQELTTAVAVQPGQTLTQTIKPLRRDYASVHSGASASTAGPNYGDIGCGPGSAIDEHKGTVWSTDATGPQDLFVDLGRALDITQVRIDPRAGCGDPPESSLARYELAASDGNGAAFDVIAGGTIGLAELDARGYATLALTGDLMGRRVLRLRAIEPRDPDSEFMDVAEIEVLGTPSAVPPPTPTPPGPSATPTPTPPAAVSTAFRVSRLTASRKGMFKVKVRFGSTAPAGKARLRVLVGKKRLADGTLAVRRLKTSTKTLTLNSTGRRMIKPGKSRKVTLELRLPGGKKVTKTVRLARRR